MISKEHRKHSKLARPAFGRFGRHEWAILGAPCSTIQALADSVIQTLGAQYRCAYLDAEHAEAKARAALPGRLRAGAKLEYTDKIGFHQMQFGGIPGAFQWHAWFNEADLVLVNGNHFEAQAQVVVIDPVKENSLKKRIDQLTDVQLFLLADDAVGVSDFVREHVPDWATLPCFPLRDTARVVDFFVARLRQKTAPLDGLVLAGGQSLRLGQDKGKLRWYGREQRYHMADLLRAQCREVFISCRQEQRDEIDAAYPTLPDTFTGLGPYGAILSAFRERPDSAWLVAACDLPLLDAATLSFLVENRDASSIATSFESPFDGLPEPLITLWEPKSYAVLLSFLAQGHSCPRKALLNNPTRILQAPDTSALTNVNTPEEMETVLKNWPDR